ncbi:MAG: hypothetical protein Q8Q62_01570 [Mesorhizobium sp.]|nr:hypothetical protein [Mesorhizobium sp.]
MPILTIESGGKITLTREILDHLGISPGERISVARLPNGKLELFAAPTKPSQRGASKTKGDGHAG